MWCMMSGWRRFDEHGVEAVSRLRWPWLTLAVLAATAAVVVAQSLHPPLVDAWQWNAERVRQGQLWRMVTGAFVHTAGPAQIASNLFGLLFVGWLVEQQWSRLAWVLAALAGVATAELAALFWYPVGGGISVALGGLVGLAMIGWLFDPRLPMWFRFGLPVLYVLGAIYIASRADIHGPPIMAGAVVGLFLLGKRRSNPLPRLHG